MTKFFKDGKFIKGLAMMIMILVAALQSPPVVWASTIIMMIITGGGYFVKNYLLPSTSVAGQFNWRDWLGLLILAVLTAVGESIGTIVVGGVLLWSALGKTVLYVIGTYFTTTFLMGDTKKVDPPVVPPVVPPVTPPGHP